MDNYASSAAESTPSINMEDDEPQSPYVQLETQSPSATNLNACRNLRLPRLKRKADKDSSEVWDHFTRVHKYNPEDIRLAIAEMIICNEIPFRVVESPWFIKLCRALELRFQVPSCIVVAWDCMLL